MSVARSLPPPLLVLLTGLALAASACGTDESSSPAAGSPSTRASSAHASDPGVSKVATPRVGPLEQFVKVSNVGVGYGVPKDWVTVEATDVHANSAALQRASQKFSETPEQLAQELTRNGVQALSIANRVDGEFAPDNVIAVGAPNRSLPDNQIKQRLTRLGATIGPLRHSTTPVGPVTEVGYYVVRDRALLYGEMLVVNLDDAFVAITVTSVNTSRRITIEQEVWRTLQRL